MIGRSAGVRAGSGRCGWPLGPGDRVHFPATLSGKVHPIAGRGGWPLGAEGQGYSLALDTLEHSRPGIAAQAVGIAQGATALRRLQQDGVLGLSIPGS